LLGSYFEGWKIIYPVKKLIIFISKSRIQVRTAFSLYLFKIQVRLVAESQIKDDSNLQQMVKNFHFLHEAFTSEILYFCLFKKKDLVIRFIKKAAPNLSQEFKVYVPSKRLPLAEQKRMLAKQLHDFLHVYRKDTEQIRIETNSQLEAERKKYANKLIDEKAFQTLLYKCTESELEEIMSIYMKNSQDSSVFLGSTRTFQTTTTNAHITSNSRSPSAVASSSSLNKFENKDDSKIKQVHKSNSSSGIVTKPTFNFENETTSQVKDVKKSKRNSSSPTPPSQSNREAVKKIENESENVAKERNADEFSNVSCDSHSRSIFSNSSGNDSDGFSKSSRSRSRSNSSTSSTKNKRKTRPLSKRHEKLNPYLISLPGRRQNKVKTPVVNYRNVSAIIKRGSNRKNRNETNGLKDKNATSSYASISGRNEEYEKIMSEIHSKRNSNYNGNNDANAEVKELKNKQLNKSNSINRPSTSLSVVTLTRSNSSTGKFYGSK
jgi:hypothetical protein